MMKEAFDSRPTKSEMFLEDDTTESLAQSLWENVEMAANSPEALKWQPLAPSGTTGGRSGLQPTTCETEPIAANALSQTHASLEKLLEDGKPILGDCTSLNANFRILVDKNGQGWAECVRATTVARGDLFVSFGSGNRVDEAEAKKKMDAKHNGCLCTLNSDSAMIAYRTDTVKLMSLYSLYGQLVLEGNRHVELSFHQLTPKSGIEALERHEIVIKRKRHWVCAKPRSDNAGVRWDNIARLIDVASLPNEVVQIVWELKKEMQAGIAALHFERPFLGFNKAMTFQSGDFFRWA